MVRLRNFFFSSFSVVEREQLAEETPILYRLTVGDSSPSPKSKATDEAQSPQITTEQQQFATSTDASSVDTNIPFIASKTAISTAADEESERLAQDHAEHQANKGSTGSPAVEISRGIS